jgi:hypothetical protein
MEFKWTNRKNESKNQINNDAYESQVRWHVLVALSRGCRRESQV